MIVEREPWEWRYLENDRCNPWDLLTMCSCRAVRFGLCFVMVHALLFHFGTLGEGGIARSFAVNLTDKFLYDIIRNN